MARNAIEKSLGRVIVGSVLLIALVGCAASEPLFLQSADTFANVTVGPEYLRYVASDSSLSAEMKMVRVENVEAFRRVIEAKKSNQ